MQETTSPQCGDNVELSNEESVKEDITERSQSRRRQSKRSPCGKEPCGYYHCPICVDDVGSFLDVSIQCRDNIALL
jgi:hypothetical protein